MAGITVAVCPASLDARPRAQTQVVHGDVHDATSAALNAYAGGQLTLDRRHAHVRIPIVVRPVALAAPTQVSGSYSVTFGYTGPFTATARGLVPAAVTAGTVRTIRPTAPAR